MIRPCCTRHPIQPPRREGPYQSTRRVYNRKPGGYRYGVSKRGVVMATAKTAYAMPLNG